MNRFRTVCFVYVFVGCSFFVGCGSDGTCRFDADCTGTARTCDQGKCVQAAQESGKDTKDAGVVDDPLPSEPQEPGEVECQDGHTRRCYTGPEQTRGVGLCKEGTQTCVKNLWDKCVGEVTPVTEVCNAQDDNCDGRVDEGCDCKPGDSRNCYTGPTGTAGQGACKEGTQRCSNAGKWEECQNAIKPQPEICNGQDDDCNGKIDDNLSAPPCGLTQGVCQGAPQRCGGEKGWLACDAAAYTQHHKAYEADEKSCDNLDNDCDGQIDENLQRSCYEGTKGCQPSAQGGYQCEGICRFGTQICRAGKWETCQGQQLPEPETCNGKDDDCNGQIDEICVCKPGEQGDCYNGPTNTDGKGICQKGRKTCQANGQWGPCSGEITPQTETCNGKDDDCNGQIDESLTGPPCSKSFGVCLGLRQRCGGAQGWLPCSATDYAQYNAAYESSEVSCDNKDNDCDGSIDENLSRPCYTGKVGTEGKGLCKGGIQVCLNGTWGNCTGEVTPQSETCNGNDDDCNGQIDDNVPGVGQSCTVPGQQGECAVGVSACINGSVACQQVHQPKAEDCNNQKDDDCNGKIDDCSSCTNGQTQPCYTPTTGCTRSGTTYQCDGSCKTGTQTCTNGQWSTCTNEVGPQTETCNWKDDDCDGTVDNHGACLFTSWGPLSIPVGAKKASFLHPELGLAIGTSGQIWRTINGGQTWQTVTSNTADTLNHITWIAKGLILAVGVNGTIVRSIDQGLTFQKITSGTTQILHGVALSTGPAGQYAVAVGHGGTVLTSTNGGETWTTRTSGTQATLYAVTTLAPSSSTMIAVGTSGTILLSVGGTTWTRMTSGTTQDLFDVVFRDGVGMVVGSQGVAKRSTDSGQSWATITLPDSPNLTHLLSPGNETFVAAGTGNTYYLSVDNGLSFVKQTMGQAGPFSSIAMKSPTILVALASGLGAQAEGPVRFQEVRPALTFYNVAYSNYDTSGNMVALAVGDNGTLYRSENEGAQWNPVYLPTHEPLYGVSLYGTNAVIVGNNGIIYHSADTGKTWKLVGSGTTQTLHGVTIDSTNVIAVGTQGTLLHSTDGGKTWSKLTAPESPDSFSALYSVSMKTNVAVAAGSGGWVIQSSDSGKTWKRVAKSLTANTLRGIYYYPLNTTAVAVGLNGTIIYSTDGGTTWAVGNSGTTNTLYGVGADYSDVFATGSNGTLLKSSDRGKTWVAQPSFFNFTMYSIMRNYLTGIYATVGDFSAFFITGNYGQTWSYVISPSTSLYASISPTTNLFLAVGTSSLFYRTTDFGQNWVLQGRSPTQTYHALLHDKSKGTLMTAGTAGSILRSTDNGQSWSVVSSGISNTLYGGSAATQDIFVLVGSSSAILRSTNGGTSFSTVTSPVSNRNLRGAHCSASTCLIVGDSGTILSSTNAGQSWSTVTSPSSASLVAVAWGSSTNAVIVGESGTALYSQDGGKTWKPANTPVTHRLSHVISLSAEQYIAVDSAGHLLISGNGGKTWSIHSPGLGHALHSFSLQGSLGIGVGDNGLRVLYTKP